MYESYLSKFVIEPNPDHPYCVIRIAEAPFKGVSAILGNTMKFEKGRLQFEYHILENPVGVDQEDSQFQEFMGLILLAIIEKNLKK